MFLQHLSSTFHQVLLHFCQHFNIFGCSLLVAWGYKRIGAGSPQWSPELAGLRPSVKVPFLLHLSLSLLFLGGRRTSTLLTDTFRYKCVIPHDTPVTKTGHFMMQGIKRTTRGAVKGPGSAIHSASASTFLQGFCLYAFASSGYFI